MENNQSGFLLINKPVGPTSHDIIDKLRRITSIKKIGHAGTLDPFASGLLIVAVGRQATKKISQYVKLDKEYVALLKLGAKTDTQDRTGKIEIIKEAKECEIEEIKKVLKKFTGLQKQTPPMFSAKKVGGKKLYELARKGIEIKREPVEINIYELELINYEWPIMEIRVKCSSGTYIRTLGNDIGEALGCGAYLEELKRTKVGEFLESRAISLEEIKSENWTENLFNV